MVRAHTVGTDLSVYHLFSSFSNPTINSSHLVAPKAPQFLYAAPAFLPRSQQFSSFLERRMANYSSSLTATQLQMDGVIRSFEESTKSGSALAFVLGVGVLARNVRFGFTIAEGMFAGLANMSARARVAGGALGAMALVGCGEGYDPNYKGYVDPRKDAGNIDAGVKDGGEDTGRSEPSPAKPPFVMKRVNVGANGIQANKKSWSPGLSDNNNVVYVTSADNLSPDQRKDDFDVMLNSKVITKSIPAYGKYGYNRTPTASISGDGSCVSFSQRYYDALSDWYGSYIVNIKNSNNAVQFSTKPSPNDASDDYIPAVSYTCDSTVYVSSFNPNYTEKKSAQISIGDWIKRGVVSTNGYDNHQIGNNFSFHPKISGDGKWVTFASESTDLLPGLMLLEHSRQIYERQIVSLNNPSQRIDLGSTWLISKGIDGKPGNGNSDNPSINSSGTVVAFDSKATNLVPNDTNNLRDVFIKSNQTEAEIVSIGKGGVPANGDSYTPSISADGRFVAFVSEASNLVDGDVNGVADIFVYDRVAKVTKRVNIVNSGQGFIGANGKSYEPFIAPNGHALVFTSDANNLVPNDTNNESDIFYVGLDYFFK